MMTTAVKNPELDSEGSRKTKARAPATNASCVGNQTTFWIHCSHTAVHPQRLPRASRTQTYTPPFHPVASSAATRAVGMRKRIAGMM